VEIALSLVHGIERERITRRYWVVDGLIRADGGEPNRLRRVGIGWRVGELPAHVCRDHLTIDIHGWDLPGILENDSGRGTRRQVHCGNVGDHYPGALRQADAPSVEFERPISEISLSPCRAPLATSEYRIDKQHEEGERLPSGRT